MSAHHNKKEKFMQKAKKNKTKIIFVYTAQGGFLFFVGEVKFFTFVGIGQLDEPVKIKGHTFFVIV
jgi:hypothetical protein